MPCPELCCLELDRGNVRGADSPVVVENTRSRKEMQYGKLAVLQISHRPYSWLRSPGLLQGYPQAVKKSRQGALALLRNSFLREHMQLMIYK